MKRSLTLLVASALLCALQSKAQSYTEGFEGGSVPGCARLTTSYTTTLSSEVINGTGSLFSNPPVNNSGTRDYASPFLNITSTSLTISYWYKLNEILNGNAVRTIQVGLESVTGVYTTLNMLTIDKNTLNQNNNNLYSIAVTAPSAGIYRLVLKMGGNHGAGTVRIIVDDITINAAPYYGDDVCNTAPVAVNDTYITATSAPFSDNVISNTVGGSDNEPNGESMSAIIVTQPDPSVGTVALNADGSFTFTPAIATFTGGPVTFTYQLTDNGFTPASSNIATVTINYPEIIPAPLPIKLISFDGRVITKNVQLKWHVAANETGEQFQILRSEDGKHYTPLAVIQVSDAVGEEVYIYTDPKELNRIAYYKIKIINKDNSIAYSNIVALRSNNSSTTNALSILRNPVASTLFMAYTSTNNSIYQVTIYTAAGVKVSDSKINMQKGANSVSLDLNHALPAGTYILEVSNGVERQVVKFIKN